MRLPSLVEEIQSKCPRLVDGGKIALAGSHDRAAKEDLKLMREGTRITQLRFLAEPA